MTSTEGSDNTQAGRTSSTDHEVVIVGLQYRGWTADCLECEWTGPARNTLKASEDDARSHKKGASS